MRAAIIVREATEADIADVSHVKAQGWATSYADSGTPELLATWSSPQHWLHGLEQSAEDPARFLFVAQDTASVVGFAQGDFGPTSYLASLHVLPRWRGQGIGARLMAQVAAAALERQSVELELDVVTTNHSAIAFYERLGAVGVQEHPADWATGVTETRMVMRDLADLARRTS